MAKPRVIIADEDAGYIVPLQYKFVKEFFNQIEIDVITDRKFFNEFFSKPQNAEILIVSEELYNTTLQKHNISHIFVMVEQLEVGGTGDLNVNRLNKYTSIKEIFNEIIGKSAGALNVGAIEKKETQIILVTSAAGGVGKTTVAMGIAASLTKNYKRVLYINAARLQMFQHMLENPTAITSPDVYAKLAMVSANLYSDIKHVVRTEIFSYLPPFKAALMSLGLQFSIYEKIILSAKKSGDFDFIIVDADTAFDEEKANLLNVADKVLIVTKQTMASVASTNVMVSNINGVSNDKYIFVCNEFDKEMDNALIFPGLTLKFTISEYIDCFSHRNKMKPEDFSKESGIQKTAFLII